MKLDVLLRVTCGAATTTVLVVLLVLMLVVLLLGAVVGHGVLDRALDVGVYRLEGSDVFQLSQI